MSKPDFKQQYGPWALVAGASEGIGAAFADQLAARGLHLALVARRAPMLDQLRNHLTTTYGIEVRTIPLDLSREDAALTIANALADVEVGLLVYNAALSVIGAFVDQPLEDHLAEIATNVRTPMSLAHIFGKTMRARRRGGIILMSSLSALQGTAAIANYTATKSYNRLLAEGLWEELRHSGVDVMACAAGAVATPNYLDSLSTGGTQSKGAPMGAMPPAAVVRETLAALGTTSTFFPGRSNRVVAFMMRRLLPHTVAIRMIGRVMRQMYGNYDGSA